jgi:hypothetical protein
MDPKDVTAVLSQAVKAVADAAVPADLKSLAFDKAVDLLSRKPSAAVGVQAALTPTRTAASPDAARDAGSPIDRLAARLKVSVELVEAVFTPNGPVLEISVPPDRIAKSMMAGARELAVLAAVADQFTSDEPTASDGIRAVIEDYNRYDGPNFARALGGLKGTLLIGGPARARTYKLTRPGWAYATELVARLGAAKA